MRQLGKADPCCVSSYTRVYFAEQKLTDEKRRASPSLGRCVVTVCCCCVTSRPCGTVSLTVRPACCSCSDAFVPEFPPVSESSCEPELCCQPHAEETRRFRRRGKSSSRTRVTNIRVQPSFIFVAVISCCYFWVLTALGIKEGSPGPVVCLHRSRDRRQEVVGPFARTHR